MGVTTLSNGKVYRVLKSGGLRLVAREDPSGHWSLFTPTALFWSGTRGQAAYRVLPSGEIVWHGNPTGWRVSDLAATGQTLDLEGSRR